MNFWNSAENCESYIQLADGYDGKELLEHFHKYISKGSKVLELGMGPGKDLDMLREDYQAVGTDYSDFFVKRYKELHPDADVRQADAITLEGIPSKDESLFDAVYSNKVLQHLTKEEAQRSLENQAKIIKDGGYLFHALWYGEKIEHHKGLLFTQYTENSIRELLPDNIHLESFEMYDEMGKNDSLWVLLQKRSD